jgi:hypothetical protein
MRKIKRFNSSAEGIAKLILVALLSATFLNTFITSYSNIKVTESVSWHLNDGWCDPKVQGFGEHCFGDYYAPLKFANSEFPWNGVISNYPPFAFVILKPLAYLNEHSQGRISLIVYLSLMLSSLLFPVLHVWRKNLFRGVRLIAFFGVSLISGPVITVLDRGNTLAFTLPFVYLYFVEIKNQNYKRAIIFGIVFILIKPQLVILTLLLFALRKYREIMKMYSVISLVTLISFAFYPTNYFENIVRWLHSTISYQSISAIGVLQPVNLSIKSTVDVGFMFFGSQINQTFITLIVYSLAVYFAIRFFVKFAFRTYSHNVMIVTLFPILFMGTTYHYYLILILVPLSLFLIEKDTDAGSRYELQLHLVYGLVFLTTLIPVVLPWSLIGRFDGRGWENVSSSWLVAQIALSIGGLFLNHLSSQQRINH